MKTSVSIEKEWMAFLIKTETVAKIACDTYFWRHFGICQKIYENKQTIENPVYSYQKMQLKY